MTKFNLTTKGINETVNYEGAKAYTLTPEFELYTLAVTSLLSDTFYESSENIINRLRELIAKNKPEFVARLAIFAREKMHLRSMPMVLTVELAKYASGSNLIGNTIERVVQRADEITELLAYYQLANNRKGKKKLNRLSKQIQKGLAKSFNKFDEYQFAKYNRQNVIKLRDALFLVHPKAKDEAQQVLFNKIVTDTLETPYTWETELSALGQQKFEKIVYKKEALKAKWTELIQSKKIGYMALLRNLRNILDAKVDNIDIQTVCEYLTNTKAVVNSKQLPFRYLSAYRELKNLGSLNAKTILMALENAALLSANNIKGFDDDTKVLVACDVSGSMYKPISPNSKILNFDIGLMMAMMLKTRCKNIITGMFGNSWKIINVPQLNILANVDEFYLREGEVGYSTNGYLVIQDLLDTDKMVDKVMIFTDCQLWNSNPNSTKNIAMLWKQYKTKVPTAKLYLFDLSGYGNTPLNLDQDNDVYLIAGWSDKIFDTFDTIENGRNILDEINEIEI